MSARDSRKFAQSTLPANDTKRRRALRRLWLPTVLCLAIAAGGLTGIVVAYQLNYSRAANEVASLATYRPSQITRVYADDGETVIGEFALERRVPLRYDEIPPVLKNAILAVEDARFYKHVGIDPVRIVGAVVKNVRTGSREGGSTLTQQLAKNLFLSREQTLTRKMSEWVMALQIERYYTKNQIMEMYVNLAFLGARAYGFEAASETYFGKQAKDLSLDEAALLAGIPRSPTQYSPTINSQGARERRNLVLQLMADNEFVSQAEADAAKARPIKLADTAYHIPPTALREFVYPVEEIRQQLEDQLTTRVAQSGLVVYSTINVEAQKKAYEAVRAGLRIYDRGRGWRSAYQKVMNGDTPVTSPQQLAAYTHPDWYGNRYEANSYVTGLVTEINAARNEAMVRFGSYTAVVTTKDMGWSGRQPKSEFSIGTLAEFKIVAVDEANKRLKVELSQVPSIQSALLTLNARNGEIAAMIGGYDGNRDKFNTATQAYRQTGSAFKPFIYTAAVEWGLTPNSIVSGAPIKRGSWQPRNYDGSVSNGDVPMRVALAKSLNVPAVHLLDMVGIQTGAQMVRRFGITVPMAPYLPSALGATEVPLIQMVSAYSAFANKGVRVEPHLIRSVIDRDGTILQQWEKTTYKVMSEYVALTMVDLMRGTVEMPGGTAVGAKALGVQVAGKTGTVNDTTDVWFIGYTPTYVTGVWMGYPERKQSLGAGMTGGRAALPVFVDFMRDFLKDKEKETFEKPPDMPEDIKELFEQRQREMAEEREAQLLAARANRGNSDNVDLPNLLSEPKLEQVTLPPPASSDADARPSTTTTTNANTTPPGRTNETTPRTPEATTPPPPPASTRPREVDPTRKKGGKKGTDEPGAAP